MVDKLNDRERKTKLVIFTLFLMTLVFVAIFLFLGLTHKNIHFYLPRRLLRVGAVLLVSYCIGSSSVVFQTITNNHILTPSVMGLDSLYMFIQTVVVFFFGSRQIIMMTGQTNFLVSVGAMVFASWLLFFLLFKGEGKNVYFLVLAGMILGSLFSGLSTFMQVLLDPNEFSVLQGKMFASFSNINSDLFGLCVLIVGICILITIKDYPSLDVLSLGVDHGINLGISYKSLVLRNLMVISVLVSVSTVLVGPITFLGILVVSLARQIVPTYKHSNLIVVSTLLGFSFLLGGLLMIERVFKYETTISVVINFVGGIYFIYLMLKESKK